MTNAPITEPTFEVMRERLAAARPALPMWVENKKGWPTLRMQPTLRTNYPDVEINDLDGEEPYALPCNLHDEDLELAVMQFLEISAGATAKAIRLERENAALKIAMQAIDALEYNARLSGQENFEGLQAIARRHVPTLTEATPMDNAQTPPALPEGYGPAIQGRAPLTGNIVMWWEGCEDWFIPETMEERDVFPAFYAATATAEGEGV